MKQTALDLFNHRYKKGQKFSWLEMIDFAEAYASQTQHKALENIKLEWQQHNRDHGLSWNEVAELANQVASTSLPDEGVKIRRYIEALIEYQELLGDELDELAPIAAVHGWKTKREGIGKRSRARLNKLRITAGLTKLNKKR